MMRSILAIVAGFVVVTLLSVIADSVLRVVKPDIFAAGGTMSAGQCWAVLGYTAAFEVIAGWITGILAPRAPVRHAAILGAFGAAFTIAASIPLWYTAPGWYHAVAILMALPVTVVGGMLTGKSRPASAS